MLKSFQESTVFVSSTSEDLNDYRAVARNVILDMHWHPVMMEHFDARPGSTADACFEAVERCDVFLLIVAWRQGYVPTEQQGGDGVNSITALELAHARKKGIPVLILLAADSWPGSKWEDEAPRRDWVRRFREGLNQIASFFEHEPPSTKESERLPRFRAILKQTLLAHKERLLVSGGGFQNSPLDFYGSARDGLLEGKDVPVLGCGIFGDGPLGSESLVKALLQRTHIPDGFSRERLSLATAAEYRERFDGSRAEFLEHFRRLLTKQQSDTHPPLVLSLLSSLPKLPLIVSATYDCLIEEHLQRAGRRFVTVAHVLRSYEGERDGCILLCRDSGEIRFCRADQLQVSPEECVVYKPQGSPLLDVRIDPELEIDSVVVTETDHALFLQRLESVETGVPGPVRSRFRRSPLLFLGYTMDTWQYRLMMLVFQSARRQDGRASTRAVRIPDSDVEEVAWNRLNASLIRMDPNEFAQSTLAAGAAG